MSGGIEIRDEQLTRLMKSITDRARDLRPVLAGPVDKYVTSIFIRQFASAGRFGGAPWPALKPRTVLEKARLRRGGMGILRRYNVLWSSYVKSGGPFSLRVIGRQDYQRGSRVRYAAAHQGGFGKGLAIRQIVPDPLPPEVTATLERLIKRHLEAA